MTPQLMQAIKLLQLSNLDLVAYVEAELERNPLLDRGADGPEAPVPRADGRPRAPDPAPARIGEALEPTASQSENGAAIAATSGPDSSLRSTTAPRRRRTGRARAAFRPARRILGWAGVGSAAATTAITIWKRLSPPRATLADWLREQLALAITDPAQRMIGQYLIDLVDEAGYLGGDLDAAAERLGTGTAKSKPCSRILQKFDPPGVFARDLAECLAIQLRELDRFDPAMQALVARLDLLAGAISPR